MQEQSYLVPVRDIYRNEESAFEAKTEIRIILSSRLSIGYFVK